MVLDDRPRLARSTWFLTAVVAVLLGLVACGNASRVDSVDRATTTDERPTTTTDEPTTDALPTTEAPIITAGPTTIAPAGVTVTEVVDGDTIVVDGRVRVRLIGIDTPERGSPGYHESSDALAALVAGKRVQLVPGARDDADRYGRLLRYVEVDGVDVNLEMIRSGQARTRYDSRDGYGAHSREAAYVEAGLLSPDLWSSAASMPTTTAAPAARPFVGSGGSDPRFGTCKEAKANGFGPYQRGVDPEYDWYRDADGDGSVCE